MKTNNRKAQPFDIQVGQILSKIRKLRGLSQEKLAHRCGITFQQIGKYEKGFNRISASRLKQLSDILEVPVSDFFSDDLYKCSIMKMTANELKIHFAVQELSEERKKFVLGIVRGLR